MSKFRASGFSWEESSVRLTRRPRSANTLTWPVRASMVPPLLSQHDHIMTATGLAVGALVAISIAFRGLFFPPQQMVTLLVACVLAAAALWTLTPKLRSPLDWAALALPSAFLVSIFMAVHPDSAAQAWLLRCLYLVTFWTAGELGRRSARARTALLHGLILGGLLAAGSGLAAAAGLLPGRDFFAAGRINTAIQYPDAAAAYLAATALLTLGLRGAAQSRSARMAYGLVLSTLLFVFVFALSRGAALVFVPSAALAVVLLARSGGLDGFMGLVTALIAVAVAALPYTRGLHAAGMQAPPGALAVVETLGALWATSLLADLGWETLRRRPIRQRAIGLTTGLAVAAVLSGMIVRLHLVSKSVGRLGQVSLSDYNAWSRLQWAHDALRMVAARPIFGWGGGGWAAAFQAYQSYDYYSTQVHDGWVQIWLSTGTVGFLCWLAFWACLVFAGVIAYRRTAPAERPVVVGLIAAVTMIGLHSLIDFTLSLGAISLALWTMAGLIRAYAVAEQPSPKPAGRQPRPVPRPPAAAPRPSWAITGGLSLLVVLASLQLAMLHHLSAGARALSQGDPGAAVQQFGAGLADDPLCDACAFDRGQIEFQEGQQLLQTPTRADQGNAELQAAGADLRRAVALNPYSVQERQQYASFLGQTGDAADAMKQLQAALRDQPYGVDNYSAVAMALIRAAATAAQSGQIQAARVDLDLIPGLAAQLAANSAAVPPEAKRQAQIDPGTVPPVPSTTPGLDLALGEAETMEGQLSAAESTLQPLTAQAGQLGGEADLWLAAVEQSQHLPTAAADTAKAQKLLGTAYAPEASLAAAVLGRVTH